MACSVSPSASRVAQQPQSADRNQSYSSQTRQCASNTQSGTTVIFFNFSIFGGFCKLSSFGFHVENESIERNAAAEQVSCSESHLLHLHHLELIVHSAELLHVLSCSELIEATTALEALVGPLTLSESPIHLSICNRLITLYNKLGPHIHFLLIYH